MCYIDIQSNWNYVMSTIIKYPRTPHLEGSRLQPGDSTHDQTSLNRLTTGLLVWEEKLDGANCGISFDHLGKLQIQSRGHFLTGGARETQFNVLKQWATCWEEDLYIVLGDRYVMYGEWCYAKHSVWYDQLPHYFLEFDVLDKKTGSWLATLERHQLLKDLPVVSVPVVHQGHLQTCKQIENLIQPSLFKSSNWRNNLAFQCTRYGHDFNQVCAETNMSDLSEGLYIKQELNGQVIGRYKYVRWDFVQTIISSSSHWADRPILPNRLKDSVDLFGQLT
jgi:hypothetical protein